jgi:hypothetical protein
MDFTLHPTKMVFFWIYTEVFVWGFGVFVWVVGGSEFRIGLPPETIVASMEQPKKSRKSINCKNRIRR